MLLFAALGGSSEWHKPALAGEFAGVYSYFHCSAPFLYYYYTFRKPIRQVFSDYELKILLRFFTQENPYQIA